MSPGRIAIVTAGKPNAQGATGKSSASTAHSRRARPRRALGDVVPAAAPRAPGAVSGTGRTTTNAATMPIAWTTYGQAIGAGANSAIRPDTSGPRPNPAESASVARRAPAAGDDSSCTQTLPGLITDPVARP